MEERAGGRDDYVAVEYCYYYCVGRNGRYLSLEYGGRRGIFLVLYFLWLFVE